MSSKEESNIWFHLYDYGTGKPYKGTTPTKVSVPVGSDIDQFRDAVKVKYSDSHLKGISPSDLLVFKNKQSFDERKKEVPLEEDSLVDGLGKSKKDALIVSLIGTEMKEELSPLEIDKEAYVSKIQELVGGPKFSDSLIRSLTKKPRFYRRLHECTGWTRNQAKEFVEEAKLILKTTTKLQVGEAYGYRFGEIISHMSHVGTIVQSVYDDKSRYCAKIGRLDTIKAEVEVGEIVVGPCVMPIIQMITLSEGRSAMFTPVYVETVADWLLNLDKFPNEEAIISILLCGISAIYSFASQGLAHCDIKLTNLMFETRTKVVLIDFGSAKKFGGFISSTTPGMGFEHHSPSIRYDVNSLSISIARVMLKKPEEFASKDHLFATISPLTSTYPVVFEMLGLMRIDEDINSAEELLDVWKNVYQVAKSRKEVVSLYSYYAPPE